MVHSPTSRLAAFALYTFYFLLAYMPLHILLSTWIGTSFGILEFAKVAKDIVLVIGFLAALTVSLRTACFRNQLKDRLLWVILAYAALTLLLAAIKPTDQDAEILGVVYSLRFLLFFLYGWLLCGLFPKRNLIKKAVMIVLASGLIVSFFGVVQYTVLPDDALTRIGYSRENGVLPAFFIDDKPDLERIMSTVRDPNSLGSYLIIIASLGLVLDWRYKEQPNAVQILGGVTALSLLALLLTFSRSAWLGMVFAVGVWLLVQGKSIWRAIPHKKLVVACFSTILIIGSLGLFIYRDSYFVQNVIFHADEATVLEDPNQLRARFLQESIEDINENPLGTGPGTAGLASIRNDIQGTELNENYYLQIASEVGIFGLLLFITILCVVARRLWHLRSNPVALALLVSFAGLAFTNLLVHIWSNEAVAYTWWGVAGLVLFSSKSKDRPKTTVQG